MTEINNLLQKYDIDQSGFLDIKKWKAMGLEEIKELESYYEYITSKAKERVKKVSEKSLEKVLNELQSMNKRMDNMESQIKQGFDQVNQTLESQHIENIIADNLLLNEIRSLRESVVFINRKIADTELEVNLLKNEKNQSPNS